MFKGVKDNVCARGRVGWERSATSGTGTRGNVFFESALTVVVDGVYVGEDITSMMLTYRSRMLCCRRGVVGRDGFDGGTIRRHYYG